MMKAVVKAKPEPGLWLEDVPLPTVGGDDCQISAKEKGVRRRGGRLSKFVLVPGTQGRANSQLYGL
jgi:hypothetical protein